MVRIRSFTRDLRRPSRSPWPTRFAWTAVAAMALLIAVIIARNVSRHDALTRWRMELEVAAGRPDWPAWSAKWPELPVPERRRHDIPTDLHGPYAYAATHPAVLERIPCYCGCASEGHRSNLSCFVAGFRGDGTPIWTDHSFHCEMCVHIAREVMLMTSLGMPLVDVRAAIDQHYSTESHHRPTNTPLPSQTSRNVR